MRSALQVEKDIIASLPGSFTIPCRNRKTLIFVDRGPQYRSYLYYLGPKQWPLRWLISSKLILLISGKISIAPLSSSLTVPLCFAYVSDSSCFRFSDSSSLIIHLVSVSAGCKLIKKSSWNSSNTIMFDLSIFYCFGWCFWVTNYSTYWRKMNLKFRQEQKFNTWKNVKISDLMCVRKYDHRTIIT